MTRGSVASRNREAAVGWALVQEWRECDREPATGKAASKFSKNLGKSLDCSGMIV